MSQEIIGGVVALGLPKPDLSQDDPKKGDYVYNKDVLFRYVDDKVAALRDDMEAPGIPTFDLAAMGLAPVKTNAESSFVEVDTAEICAALEKGSVQFNVVLSYAGVSIPISCVANATNFEGAYCCASTILVLDIVWIAIIVSDGAINCAAITLAGSIDAYMEEALGGDY